MKYKERFFIVYDFVSDSRRAQCVKVLEKYGVRVQYSIFEFSLTKARKIEFLAQLKKRKFLEDRKGEAMMIVPVSAESEKHIERYGDTVDILGKAGVVVL